MLSLAESNYPLLERMKGAAQMRRWKMLLRSPGGQFNPFKGANLNLKFQRMDARSIARLLSSAGIIDLNSGDE